MTRAAADWSDIKEEIEAEWQRLQSAHPLLSVWSLELASDTLWSNPMGACYFEGKWIVLFRKPLRDDLLLPQTIDTLRHEAAHALAGAVGHGAEWRRFAKLLGANPKARYEGPTPASVEPPT